ncbi:MAG: molybdopterin molybdotransferase, partial [Marinomonas primoryensis]
MSTMLTFEDALQEIKQSATLRVVPQTIALSNAAGRILAKDIAADIFVPPHDNSAMDGYALARGDWQADKIFTISQRIPAGQSAQPLVPGTCARIFTGANIPSGADTVIMQEDTKCVDDHVAFAHPPKKGD